MNLTDEDSRIMPMRGGCEHSYHAQAVVDTQSMLILATDVSQAPNDKEQIIPLLEKLYENPEELNQPEALLADTGYFSEKNVLACPSQNIEPFIAAGRESHNQQWRDRFTDPEPLTEGATPEAGDAT